MFELRTANSAEAFFNRKRKPKDPCTVCYLNRNLCICEVIPTIDLKTKISIIVHKKELKRTTNTGRLALRALTNSEMRIRGDGKDVLDLSDLLTPQYRSVLFFPCYDAQELTSDFVAQSDLPIHLIVPDGNWRQARKVPHRHRELSKIPRVKISTPNLASEHLRKETSEYGMSTLEAIGRALAIIEGVVVGNQLLSLYQAKLKATLIGRGHGSL